MTRLLFITLCLALTSALLPDSVSAKIAGKNVVLIHGFQLHQLENTDRNIHYDFKRDGEHYWRNYWQRHAEAIISWDSAGRLKGNVRKQVWDQFAEIYNSKKCAEGCFFVTHSTGDLVMQDLLNVLMDGSANSQFKTDIKQSTWSQNFKLLATIDFAGAGGGSEIGRISFNRRKGKKATGILEDLVPTTARQNYSRAHDVPRLRFVGGGELNYTRRENEKFWKSFFNGLTFFATGAIANQWAEDRLPGMDDGIVAAHSACGAKKANSYWSCVTNIDRWGNKKTVGNGIESWELHPNHFPVIMGPRLEHGQGIGNPYGPLVGKDDPKIKKLLVPALSFAHKKRPDQEFTFTPLEQSEGRNKVAIKNYQSYAHMSELVRSRTFVWNR